MVTVNDGRIRLTEIAGLHIDGRIRRTGHCGTGKCAVNVQLLIPGQNGTVCRSDNDGQIVTVRSVMSSPVIPVIPSHQLYVSVGLHRARLVLRLLPIRPAPWLGRR